MTNEEAIEVLQSMKSDFPLPKAAQTRRAQNDALDVAIEALKAEPCENAMLKEIATELVKEIKEDLIITDFSGNTRTITATKAAPNVPGAPPVYAVSAGDVIDTPDANSGDTISRQAAIDVFKDTTYTKNEICRRITESPSAQPEQRWIPVAERLPEKGQKCLVSDKGHIAIDVFLGRGGVYNWQFYVRDYEAWMPLVQPYKGGRRMSDLISRQGAIDA